MSCALAAPEVLGTAHEIAHVERHQCPAAVEELNASALRTVLRAGGGARPFWDFVRLGGACTECRC